MIVSIEAFLRKSLRAFNPDEWMTRLLNLSKIKDAPATQGLVMIQIDGLGFTQAERAIKKGNVPFLTRLMKREGYGFHRHYSGLPSNTPAVQGLLFYGVKTCVPAFNFKDSQSGKVFNMFNPECAAAVENRIKDKGEPLLKEGSAYGNIFTGGAKEPHFCASSIGWGSLLKAANPFGIPMTILLNFHIFIRALFLILVEFILAIVDSIRGIILGKNFLGELGFMPLRVGVCVLLREVIATGARIDIARGLPVIHINLAGFDEQAHHRGPTSTFAHWSLRGIDSAIAKIWKAAQRSSQREYDVFIYSDHGQEDTTNYQQEYGRSVEDAVNQVLEEKISSSKLQTGINQHSNSWRVNVLQNKPGERLDATSMEDNDLSTRAIVTTMGPVGNIYLPEKLSLEEKEKIALQLVTSAEIPIVMICHGPDQAFAWNSNGKFILPEEGDKVIETSHPFFNKVVRDLVAVCHHPDAGEMIILGWKKGPKSLTFHAEQGSHAGPGPEETSGFALLPMGALPRFFPPKSVVDQDSVGICTQDLRNAAFRALESTNENARILGGNMVVHTGPAVLRIMTYNVHGCRGRDGKISPARIARIIARHHPDIIALQELEAYEQTDQTQIIAQKLGMTFHFHPSRSIKKGQRGNAILSKFPMRLVRKARLPKLSRAPFLEPRGALWVEIDVQEGLKAQVFNTHLSLSSREGILQMKDLCGPDWVGHPACQGRIVLCGDLNALASSKICKHLGRVLKNTHFEIIGQRSLKTLPSFYPLGLVDHIFVGSGLKTTKIEVPGTELEKMASDHLPLIVNVEVGACQ
jgi:endonuclease/exonuclease/phosphatase family metal-dependent hydrolase